jgi:polyhydroxyalkanoate synthesis regulator phasin
VRKKIIVVTAAGALTLGGLAVGVPALADSDRIGVATSAAVDRIRDAIDDLVADGSLTEEQADEVAGRLADAGFGGHGGGHRGGGGHGGFGLDAAADALGMTEEELRNALETEGTTLADVAEQQGLSTGDLVEALVEAAHERADAAVEDGRLTQEEADDRLADVEERISERVTTVLPERGRGNGSGPGGRGDGAEHDGSGD